MKFPHPPARAGLVILLTTVVSTSASFAHASESDYDEVAELEKLEEENVEAVLVGEDEVWTSELVAPFRGSLSALHRDLGYVAELHQLPEGAPSGAELFEVDEVRERLESTSVLGLHQHDHPAVRSYIDFFDGPGKPTIARWLKRMNRYAPMIEETLREEGLPEDLVYVAMIESGFSPWAHSPAGAVGLWQFIRTTGQAMGLRVDAHVDERRDPVEATRAAARYLNEQYERFGSWPLALAAYNGGPGLVRKTIAQYNSNDYWFIARQNGMYKETRRYVPKVVAAGLMAKNADIFGLDVLAADEELAFDEVEVPPKTRLQRVAEAVGTDVDTLEELNPALRRPATPPGKDPYTLRIPADTTEQFVRNFDEFEHGDGADHITYRVRFGETVRMIGERKGVAPHVIRAANGLEQGELPQHGSELIIPTEALDTWTPRRKRKKKKVVLLPSEEFDHPKLERYFYRVNAGDTLESIARGLGVKPADLVLWNHLDPKAHLRKGLYLQVFLSEEDEIESLALEADSDQINPIVLGSRKHKSWLRSKGKGVGGGKRWHRVRPGESLWAIARKYKVTVDKIKRWNPKLGGSAQLQPGQKLLVYPGR